MTFVDFARENNINLTVYNNAVADFIINDFIMNDDFYVKKHLYMKHHSSLCEFRLTRFYEQMFVTKLLSNFVDLTNYRDC